ncbi:hypothetical protein KFU94_53685 [Chloroflexi bacterium TSY]|nr:hypothetical protein [Chloroflexi bacterium TSY]
MMTDDHPSKSEIEFELPAVQYEVMGFSGLIQGQPLSLILDAGVLLPDPAADHWFAVQKEPLAPCFVHVGPATYAFTGQIQQAELFKELEEESAIVIVDCAGIRLRVTCGAMDDGRLPFGTWETRYLTGISLIQGIIEEDFSMPIGEFIGATVWSIRRLVLTPGDPLFGQWHHSNELARAPYTYDTVLISARLH